MSNNNEVCPEISGLVKSVEDGELTAATAVALIHRLVGEEIHRATSKPKLQKRIEMAWHDYSEPSSPEFIIERAENGKVTLCITRENPKFAAIMFSPNPQELIGIKDFLVRILEESKA